MGEQQEQNLPQNPKYPMPTVLKSQRLKWMALINSPKTNLWGRWLQSRAFCKESVGEPICQYCSYYFSNAFTN